MMKLIKEYSLMRFILMIAFIFGFTLIFDLSFRISTGGALCTFHIVEVFTGFASPFVVIVIFSYFDSSPDWHFGLRLLGFGLLGAVGPVDGLRFGCGGAVGVGSHG
jgi:hypothetical protein